MEGLKIPIGAPIQALTKDLNAAKAQVKSFVGYTDAELLKSSRAQYGTSRKVIQVNEQLAESAALAAKAQRTQAAATAASGGALTNLGGGLTKALSGLRTLAYILPGIGIAGIFNLAYEALGPLITATGLFNKELSATEQARKNINEAISEGNKSAATEITTLRTLYNAATDVNVPQETRIKAAKELIRIYPETFKNGSEEAIMNGKLGKSLQALTIDIIALARAKALESKISESTAIILDAEIKKVEAQTRANAAASKAKPTQIFDPETGKAYFTTVQFTLDVIKRKLKEELREQDAIIKSQETQIKLYDSMTTAKEKVDAIVPQDDGKAKKDVKTIKDIYAELAVDLNKAKADLNVNSVWELGQKQVDIYNSAIKKLIELGIKPASKEIQDLANKVSSFLNAPESLNFVDNIGSNLFFKQKKQLPSGEGIVKPVEVPVKPVLDTGAAYTTGQILKDYYQFDLLPQIGTSFTTFFDDILTKGEISFKALGQSITRTFASVLANEATIGILGLLGAKGKEQEKGGGLFKALGGVLGIGAKARGAAGGGILLPLLAGVGAIAGIAGLFNKKKVPTPAPSSSVSTSAINTGAVDISGGRVVFEISGVNLVGVLNRAGAKLARYGTI
jgi:hypothetical protein